MANGAISDRVDQLRTTVTRRTRSDKLHDPSLNLAICAVAAAGSALMFELAAAVPSLWMCALFAPLPLLATGPELSTTKAAQVAFLAYLVGNFASWGGESFAEPLLVLLAAHLAGAMVFATIVACAVEASRRWSGILAALVFPTVETSFYYTLAGISPHGSWGSPAYSQVDFPALMQTASVLGMSGVMFVMSLLSSGLAVAWYRRRWNMRWIEPAIMAIGVFAIAVGLGSLRVSRAPSAPSVRVALVASDRLLSLYASSEVGDAAEVLALYAKLVRQAVDAHTQVVVLPEKIVAVTPLYEHDVLVGLGRIASMSHVWLVAGVNEISRTPLRNVAVIFDSNGKLVATYLKRHLVSSLEGDYAAGSQPTIFDAPWGRTALLICKDLDFPEPARELALQNVRVVLAPAWDSPGSEEIHERMAIMRGVEMGFSVARAGRQGMVSATDSRGRVIVAQQTSRSADALVSADLPLGTGPTSYARDPSDWFGRLSVALTILLMLRLGLSIWYSAHIRRLKSRNRLQPAGVLSVDLASTSQPKSEEPEERIYRPPPRSAE